MTIFFGGLAINIETRKGMVQLDGFIDDAEAGLKAVGTAKTVNGVVAVDNQLHVKEGETSMGQLAGDRVC
jgi:hyperosmotically inducible protein